MSGRQADRQASRQAGRQTRGSVNLAYRSYPTGMVRDCNNNPAKVEGGEGWGGGGREWKKGVGGGGKIGTKI